jgi:hypothetical protein
VVTITADKVSVQLHLAIILSPNKHDLFKAYYRLEDFEGTIKSYVLDSARSVVARFHLNDLYEESQKACEHIRQNIHGNLNEAGWDVQDVLMLNIMPEARVYRAMQEVKTSQYQRERDLTLSKARKAYDIIQAQAEADAQHLRGIGLNNQRTAFLRGFQVQNKILGKGFDGFNESHVLRMMHMMAYFQSMGHIAKDAGESAVIMSHDPRAAREIVQGLVDYMNISPAMQINGGYSKEDALADMMTLAANPEIVQAAGEGGEGPEGAAGGGEGSGAGGALEILQSLNPPAPAELEGRG